jgi:hypothetical protein
MRRIGLVWCILVTLFVLTAIVLTTDFSQRDSNMLMFQLLERIEPRGLSVFLALFVLSLMLFLTAAVVCSAWNRIAPQILQGARAMTFAEAYAVVLVFALVT